MIIIKKNIYFIMFVTCTLLSFFSSSCSVLQPTPEPIKEQKQSQISHPEIKDIVEQSPYSLLEQKGDYEIKIGKYRSALNIYNHLLSKYSLEDKQKLLKKTEALLSIMKNSDLEVVFQSTKSQIPKSMLLYRLGINYAKKEENDKAKEMLTKLMADYPDDPHAEEVEQILNRLTEQNFAKNIIGCMLPLSGKYQTFGQQALKGIQMAQQDIKALYSDQEIVFIIKDTESNDDKAVACVEEFAKTNVAAIAGPMVTSEVASKEAQKQKIPMICMTQKSEITSAGDYIFSNFITPEIQIKALVSHAKEVLGVQLFAILYPNDKYGQTFMNLFKQTVAKAGGELVVAEVYSENQTDFSNAIKKIALIQSQVEAGDKIASDKIAGDKIASDKIAGDKIAGDKIAIFIPDAPSRVALILPQLMYYDVKDAYLLGTNIWHNDGLLKVAPEHTRNAIITDGYFAKSTKSEPARFAEAFKSIYGEEPGFIHAIAYDTASMLIKTAMDPSINSRESLKRALTGNFIYNGVTGETKFEENRNASKDLFFLKIENNSFVELQ